MKAKVKAMLNFLNEKYFYVFAVVGLFLPDLQLRYLVWPKVYGEVFATAVPFAFNLMWIALLFYGALVLLPKKWGRILYLVFGGAFVFFSFSQYVYFQIFEQFFRISSIGLAGEGGDYLSYAIEHIDTRLIICTLASIFCFVVTAIKWERPKHTGKWAKAMIILPVLGLVALHIFMQPKLFGESDQDWDSWSKPRVVYQEFNDANKCIDIVGIYHFLARDLYKTYFSASKYSEEDFRQVDEFFAEKAKEAQKNDYTGILEGKNVVAVMLEGIDDWMISDRYTPVMKYMMENGINFSEHYAPTFGTGYTLGSEFCFNTGYYTPISAVSAVNYTSNAYPYSLPRLFADKGYSVNSFHYNHSEFYNRGLMHKSLGYEKYHSFQDYGMPAYAAQADSNILKEQKIYEDMTKQEPFFSFVITYSGHIPYTFDDAKLALAKENHPDLLDSNQTFEENACRLLARDTDDFFRQLLEKLNEDGLLENTVIVVYTDHYAYGYSDQEELLALNKEAGDEIMYRVPAFIYSPGIKPLKVTKPTQTADLLPTLVNLFNLENNNCYIGSDALSDRNTGFAYFGNLAWMDDEMYYVPSNAEVAPEDKERVMAGNEKTKKSLDINDIVIVGDYFAHRK